MSSGAVLMYVVFCLCFVFRAGVDVRCLCYYILYIIYYIIIYYILYYSLLFYPFLYSPFLSFYPLFSSLPYSPLFSSSSSLYSSVLLPILIYLSIQSIRVGIWISLFIFHKNLTPHVLSEWMVEVCGAYLYRVGFYVSFRFRF